MTGSRVVKLGRARILAEEDEAQSLTDEDCEKDVAVVVHSQEHAAF